MIVAQLWSAISIGDMVLAPEFDRSGDPDGWWEARVVARHGERFTLQWRDYPEEGCSHASAS